MPNSVAIVTGASQGIGQPEEIADLLAYLVSASAKWMTGAALRIDGGEFKGI